MQPVCKHEEMPAPPVLWLLCPCLVTLSFPAFPCLNNHISVDSDTWLSVQTMKTHWSAVNSFPKYMPWIIFQMVLYSFSWLSRFLKVEVLGYRICTFRT